MPGRSVTSRTTLAALTVAVLGLTGCGAAGETAAPAAGPATSTPTSGGAAPATTATATPPASGAVPETLDFDARTLDGTPFAGSSLAGKPAVLWFWAAWCTRCRGVADSVAELQRDNADAVTVIGVAGLGSGDEAMRRFARETGITGFRHLADDDGRVWRKFGVTSQEHYVLLDAAGTVVHNGPLSQDELRERVAGLS